MTSSEDSMEEEVKVGDNSQKNDSISLSRFDLIRLIIKIVYSPLQLSLKLFYDVSATLGLA